MPPHIVTYPEFREKFGLPYSRDHIRRLVKTGRFPAPTMKLSSRLNAWDSATISNWCASKIAP